VLLDEIEKAHSTVQNIFLQLFDAGRITDNKGRVVDGRHALFIMTSNVASDLAKQRQPLGFPVSQADDYFDQKLRNRLRTSFSPEFLNRIDEIVIFNRLGRSEAREIVELNLRALQEQLCTRAGIDLHWEAAVVEHLAREGFDEEYGARPLRRAIENAITQPLSEKILRGWKGVVTLSVEGGQIEFRGQE